MALEMEKLRAAWLPLLLIVLWQLASTIVYHLFSGTTGLFVTSLLFFLEFGIIYSLSLYMAALLGEKLKGSFETALAGHLLLFGIFIVVWIGLTLAISLSTDGIAVAVITLLAGTFLNLIKFAFSVLGFLIGRYSSRFVGAGGWETYRLVVLALSIIAIAIAVALGLFVANYLNENIKVETTPGMSISVDNCSPGNSMYMKMVFVELNITVQGLDTFRGRTVCYAKGIGHSAGYEFNVDWYGVDSETYCTVYRNTNETASESKEECKGNWGVTGQ